MNRYLAQLQGQALGEEQARGNAIIENYDNRQDYLKAVGSFQQKQSQLKSAQSKARQKLAQTMGETQLQAVERMAPPIYKGAKEIGARTGATEYLKGQAERGADYLKNARDTFKDYINKQSPDFVRGLTEKLTGSDPRYNPQAEEKGDIEMGDMADREPVIEPDLHDMALKAVADKTISDVRNLTERGQAHFEKGAEAINEGRREPIDREGNIDPDMVRAHSSLFADAAAKYGFQEKLPGGGVMSDIGAKFRNMWKSKLSQEDPRYTPPEPEEEPVARAYREAGMEPVMAAGETQVAASARQRADITRPTPETQRPIYETPDEPVKGGVAWWERVEPPAEWQSGGVGLEAKATPAVSAAQVQSRMAAQQAAREAAVKPDIATLQSQAKSKITPQQRSMDELAPGHKVLAEVLGKKPQPRLAQTQESPLGVSGMPTRPQVAIEAEAAPPVASQQLSKASSAYVKPPEAGGKPPGSSIKEQAEAAAAGRDPRYNPVEEQSQLVPQKTEAPPQETARPSVKGTETPAEEASGAGKGALGGYGLEAGFGLAAIGELANPMAGAKEKMKEVGETAGLYAGAKIGAQALEASGAKAGLAEVMTGVEAVQDLTNKNLSGGQKAERVAGAVGTYAGAMGAEALVPGLGEIAMLGTGLGELIHGLHKEHKEKEAMEAQQKIQQQKLQQQAPSPAPLTTGIAFDNAPVLDSSNYHNQ